MKIARLFKRLFLEASLLFCNDYNSYKIYKKSLGVTFGKHVRITGRIDFGSEPFLISIGDNVTITKGTRFITHDGGVGLFRNEFPGINIFGKITIKNNVFIGNNVIILPNISVGNNVIIGVGSIVTKDIPDNVVVVGIPARVIRTIEEYKQNALKKAVYVSENNFKKRKKLILDIIAGKN